jgi:ubiquinone/menaquinone biosynthesis C-methylase UbiE
MESRGSIGSMHAGYAITQDEAELERQVRYAQEWDAEARHGLSSINVGRGWKAIDVGCGPLGALVTLAELVGPEGVVVGLDLHAASLVRARSLLDDYGLEWVQLFEADINEMGSDRVCPPGPFDVAFCRNVLTHQRDAAQTLRSIAAVLRRGGYVVAHNQMGDRIPQPDPPVPALDCYTNWTIPIFEKRGSRWVARRHAALCEEAGLRLVRQRGFFGVATDSEEIRQRRESLCSWRAAIVESGIASDADVDSAVRQLGEAEQRAFQAVFSGLYVELIAQVP